MLWVKLQPGAARQSQGDRCGSRPGIRVCLYRCWWRVSFIPGSFVYFVCTAFSLLHGLFSSHGEWGYSLVAVPGFLTVVPSLVELGL